MGVIGYKKIMNLIATGNTAEIFDYADDKILKLFKPGYPEESIKKEFDNVSVVNEQNIASPEVYDIVREENRLGIVYEKISGNDLLHEVFANIGNPDTFNKILTEFSQFHQDFLSHKSTKCSSYKDYLKNFGYKKARHLPDGDFLCHGDFHFGNLMRSNTGKIYAIDFMNLCHGPKEYDIARAYVLMTEDNLGTIPPAEKEKLIAQKREAGKFYLNIMGISLEAIEPFIPAVEFCRKREML